MTKTKLKRWRLARIGAGILVAVAAGLLLLGGEAAVSVDLETIPASASVYLNGEYMGRTPVTLRGVGREPAVLKIEHIERGTWREALVPEEFSAGRLSRWRAALFGGSFRKTIELPHPQQASLVVTSSPDGATVMLDGDRAGMTPLRLENVRPGSRSVRLLKAGHTEAVAQVAVEAGARASLHRDLVPEIYSVLEARIEEDPTNLHNYVDLAHEYLIRGRHEKVAPLMWKGHELLASGKATAGFDDERLLIRFYYECFQIVMKEFEYPLEDSLAVRKACYEILLAGNKAFPREKYISNLLRRVVKP